MFLSVRHKPIQKEALLHYVVDRKTGERIPMVIWANDETGAYRQILTDDTGRIIIEGDHAKSKIFRGEIEIRRNE